MRDVGIIRATVRELAPLLLGTLALGLLVAVTALDVRDLRYFGRPNTWPLTVLPIAALWGGLAIGGGSRTTLVHLLSRPVGRLRILAWRWALLIGGLALVAIPLWWFGQFQHGNGPGLWTIGVATLLASIFGAQGGALSDRELYSLGGAMMLAAALLVPVELALDAQQITWTRVSATLDWGWRVALLGASVVLVGPVIWTWSRGLPVRGIEAGSQLVLGSLGASLLLLVCVAWPTINWLAAPERGQLIAVVAVSEGRPVVATGTLGEDGDRDVVDSLVRIDADGARHVIWDRRDESRDITVWRVGVREASIAGALHDTIRISIVDAAEPDFLHPLETIDVQLEIEIEQPSRTGSGPTYGPLGSKRLRIYQHSIAVVGPEDSGFQVTKIRQSEIPFERNGAHAVGGGRVWAVNTAGELWSAPVPWEVTR